LETQSLDELKAENEEAEAAKLEEEALKKDVDSDSEDAADEDLDSEDEVKAGEQESESDDDDDESEGDDDSKDVEAWMETDGEGNSDEEKQFSSGDVAAAKRKLKARIGEKDDEIGALRREVEQLKSGSAQPAHNTPKPKRADFELTDDPDEAYLDALSDWKDNQRKGVDTRNNAVVQAKKVVDEQVDRHYENAGKLIKEHGINAEVYRKADESFRQAIEEVYPTNGDLVADTLISNLGEGSEKTVFNLGLNKSKILLLQSALREDSTGIKGAMYLAKVQAEVTMPKNKGRQAPAPATRINGDKPPKGSVLSRKLAKQYKSARKLNDAQSAYDVKKEAKKQGVDVSNW